MVRALAESEARYALLINQAGFGSYRSAPDGRVLAANQALVAMLGYTDVDEVLQLSMPDDIYLESAERERLLMRPTALVEPDWVETKWRRRDGSPIVVRLSVYGARDTAGNIVAYDGVVEDVTERARREELRRRNERMAGLATTLAGVAHELNNPLAAIMGFAQLLLKKQWPADDRAALETINHEAIRSATIVKDLLVLTGKRDTERRAPVNVNDVVGYIARTRRYALDTAGITLTLSLDPALPLILGDRTQLEQVLLNLLDNAEQALARTTGGAPLTRGRIEARTRRDPRDVIVEIEDNGPGIPDADQSRIWDPFWTTKEEGEGTGLGLAVVHSIVVDHAGTVSMENAPAGGARFIMRLPIAGSAELAALAAQAERPLDVLVVDPSASDLAFIERFLTSRGHAVINASNGDAAVRLAGQTPFDAVVCDARLRLQSGQPVASALAATTGCANARFVLSASPNDAPAEDLPAGARCVARPYDVEELRRMIEASDR